MSARFLHISPKLLVALFLFPATAIAGSRWDREASREADGWERFGRPEAPLLEALAVDLTHAQLRWEAVRAGGLAVAGTGVSVTLLKYLTNVRRPDGSDSPRINSSFPSGHAALAFSSAGALGELHGDLRAPLLALGVMVARSRVRQRRHRFVDVLTGAAIGYAWGRWAGRRELDDRDSRATTVTALTVHF